MNFSPPTVTPGVTPASLTDARIARLKPATKRREISDATLRGLYLVLQPSGVASWAVRYRAAGKSRKLTLGKWPAISVTAARKLAAEALVRVAAGHDPATQKRASRAAPPRGETIDGLVKSFIKRAQRTRTWREARRTINHDVLPVLKGREVSGLTRRDIHAVLDSVLARGSPIQANRVLSVMRRMFGYAVERGLIERSPCDGVKPPSNEHSRDRVLSDGELAAIWRGCDQIGLFGSLAKLLMLTGQRRSEIGAMRWSEINFEARTLNLPKERVKNATAHCVPLSESATAILLGLDPDLSSNANGLVFSTTGRPISGYSKMKAHLDAASGTAGWCLHDLRRTFVTGLARLGVDIPVIERAVNHRSGTFGGGVGTYQRHDYHQEVRAAMELWAAHISSLTSNRETD